MNAKTYQVEIDSRYKETFAFSKTLSLKIAQQLNPKSIATINHFFANSSEETITSSQLSYILAATCPLCKLPKRERIKQTYDSLEKYWESKREKV